MTHFLLGIAFIGHVKAEIRIVMKKFVLLILFVFSLISSSFGQIKCSDLVDSMMVWKEQNVSMQRIHQSLANLPKQIIGKDQDHVEYKLKVSTVIGPKLVSFYFSKTYGGIISFEDTKSMSINDIIDLVAMQEEIMKKYGAGEKEDVKDGKTGKSIGWKYKGKNGIKSLFMKTEVMGIPITGITFSWGDM